MRTSAGVRPRGECLYRFGFWIALL